MLVSDLRSGILLNTFNLQIIDDVRGLFRLVLLPTDTLDWDMGFLQYTVALMRADGSTVPVYTDYSYQPYGLIEVVGGMTPAPVPTVVVDGETDFLIESMGNPLQTYNITGGYASTAPLGHLSVLQTVAVYTTDFIGLFWVQATLENSIPTNPNAWFYVTIGGSTTYFSFVQTSGITTFNFDGTFQFVRFLYLADPANTGTLDQVMYRN
jgi:hypothetical protein